MARSCTYLYFPGTTEAAFTFYRKVFGGEFIGGIYRYSDAPEQNYFPHVSDDDNNLVMYIELPILGGHTIMGTDISQSLGLKTITGNNIYINLEPDTKAEAEKLFQELSEGGFVEMPLQDMFWRAYYGSFRDRFGVRWMLNYKYP